MRIVIVSQHFPPENSGNASRVGDMAEKLAEQGAEVTVLAPHPTFPTGSFRRKWKWRTSSKRGKVNVVNLWAWQPQAKDPGFISRIAYYLTFPLHAALWALFNPTRYDVIVGSMPPVFTGIPGWIATRIHRRKRFVVEVRDLWIDAAVSLGFVSETSLMTRLSRRFERSCYRKASLIAVTTEEVVRKIRARYPDVAAPTVVVPNGVDTSKFQPVRAVKKPQFVYAGNIGHAQDLERVIDALALVRKTHPDARLVLAGDGDTRAALEAHALAVGVADAVKFPGLVPRDRVPELYAESVAGLAPLKNLPTLEYAMPTKAYESLGCGVPFLGTGGGELRRFAEVSGGGRMAENDAESIAAAMRWFLDHPDECAEMAKAGRSHVSELYDRGSIARRYLQSLSTLQGGGLS